VAMTKMTVYARNGTSVAQTIYSLIIEWTTAAQNVSGIITQGNDLGNTMC
jgi:hypothetical protein